jgi:hypothetical protein
VAVQKRIGGWVGAVVRILRRGRTAGSSRKRKKLLATPAGKLLLNPRDRPI